MRLFIHVSSGESVPYVALSHCWGSSGIKFKTTKLTIKDYRQAISFEDLPMNFQDAVVITRSIGIRYLWIDSLCILQDDIEDWQAESSKMASIYRDAYLVLAATQAADSSEGFLDRQHVSPSFGYDPMLFALSTRNLPLQMGQIRNHNSTISKIYTQCLDLYPGGGTRARHHSTVFYSPLNRRAWVLQENVLPRRIVHFTCHEMLWECIECLKCECMEVDHVASGEESQNLTREDHFFSVGTERGPNQLHRSWLKVLQQYQALALSNESDRLPALSGLASLWSSRGAGAYLAGLWQDNILSSIIWRGHTDGGRIKRWETYRAPSWSPFALGYLIDDQKPAMASFSFLSSYYGLSEEYARLASAQCTPDGKDKMGAVKDGYIVIQTLVSECYPDDLPKAQGTFWDHGIKDAEGQEVTLILIGYYDFSYGDHGHEMRPRAIMAVPSKTVHGAYERVGILAPTEYSQVQGINKLFQQAEQREIKMV
ncbi:heterokaryon incompatibility protein [Fusarium heterosporum]|uniref:Heterokaryon incompatibility protein n=1 Tax=Fusarium heterosporum TaxID=42747 RepID=A0A8H5TAB8_FUSHE|nr:heterokaryon incompatibility protein [Fusarium heterosporum]